MKIHDYLKNNYGYSDFQIGQIRYTIISILSDVSKLIIMGIDRLLFSISGSHCYFTCTSDMYRWTAF